MQRSCDGHHATHPRTDRNTDLLCASRVGEQATMSYPRPENARSLRSVATAAKRCRACDLWKLGTQTVFGDGPRTATAMFIGEQPGDQEDKAGEPFVGPAGRVLDEAFETAGIDRSAIYLTNAVKHFKWRPKGKRRLHEKPNGAEVRACGHWLELELALVKPTLVVALGATAAQALLGPAFRVTQERGKVRSSPLATRVMATVHPSSILRAPDETRASEMAAFVKDLRIAAKLIREG